MPLERPGMNKTQSLGGRNEEVTVLTIAVPPRGQPVWKSHGHLHHSLPDRVMPLDVLLEALSCRCSGLGELSFFCIRSSQRNPVHSVINNYFKVK